MKKCLFLLLVLACLSAGTLSYGGDHCLTAPDIVQQSNSITDTSPVYRFWSDTYLHHFYTISEYEKNLVLTTWPDVWTYEGPVFYAYTTQVAGTLPVYRFWSDTFLGHFYTISETEKDFVIATWPDTWIYEGPVFYAYPTQIPGTLPVYRFWSDTFLGHFYTISEDEKDYVITTWPLIWIYEGPAFYSYQTTNPDYSTYSGQWIINTTVTKSVGACTDEIGGNSSFTINLTITKDNDASFSIPNECGGAYVVGKVENNVLTMSSNNGHHYCGLGCGISCCGGKVTISLTQIIHKIF